MSEDKEKKLEWLYRALMIAIASSVWFKVDRIDVQDEIILQHEKRLDRHEAVIFSPSWHKPTSQQLPIYQHTEDNIAQARQQMDTVDRKLNN